MINIQLTEGELGVIKIALAAVISDYEGVKDAQPLVDKAKILFERFNRSL